MSAVCGSSMARRLFDRFNFGQSVKSEKPRNLRSMMGVVVLRAAVANLLYARLHCTHHVVVVNMFKA